MSKNFHFRPEDGELLSKHLNFLYVLRSAETWGKQDALRELKIGLLHVSPTISKCELASTLEYETGLCNGY